jgi:hypothetical protein
MQHVRHASPNHVSCICVQVTGPYTALLATLATVDPGTEVTLYLMTDGETSEHEVQQLYATHGDCLNDKVHQLQHTARLISCWQDLRWQAGGRQMAGCSCACHVQVHKCHLTVISGRPNTNLSVVALFVAHPNFVLNYEVGVRVLQLHCCACCLMPVVSPS